MHIFIDGDIESFNAVHDLDRSLVRLFICSGVEYIMLTKEDLEYLLEQVNSNE